MIGKLAASRPFYPRPFFGTITPVMLTRTGHARTRTKPTRTRTRTRTRLARTRRKDKDLTHKDQDKDKDFTCSYLLQVAAKPTIAI